MNREVRVATSTFPLLHPWALVPNTDWWEPWPPQQWEKRHRDWVTTESAPAAGMTTGEIEAIRSAIWGNMTAPVMAQETLARIADQELTVGQTGDLELAATSDIDTWFRLTRHIPSDLLCAANWRYEPSQCPPKLTQASAEIQSLLIQGLCDLHVHWGAAFNYGELLQVFRVYDSAERFLERGLSMRGGEQDRDGWLPYRLSHLVNPLGALLLYGLTAGVVGRCLDGELPTDDRRLTDALKEALRDTVPCALSYEQSRPSDWLAATTASLGLWRPLLAEGASAEDAGVLGQEELVKAFRIEDFDSSTDRFFSTAFDRLLRIRTLLYDSLTQDPRLPGLDEFGEWFSRMRSFRNLSAPDWGIRSRIVALSGSAAMTHIELRTGAESGVREPIQAFLDLAADATAMNDALSQTPLVAFSYGLRKTARTARDAAPRSTETGWVRGSEWVNRYRSYVAQLVEKASRCPPILKLIRGLDTFGRETAIPNWCPALLYQYYVRLRLDPERFSSLPDIHHTFHAGEDWITPLGGIRCIHEAIKGANLAPGHRIGHGLALLDEGVRASYPDATRGILLDDLVWEWGIWTEMMAGRIAVPASEDPSRIPTFLASAEALLEIHRAQLKAAVREAASAATNDAMAYLEAAPSVLRQAYLLRFDFDELTRFDLVSTDPGAQWFEWEACRRLGGSAEADALRGYLTSRELLAAEQVVEPYEPTGDLLAKKEMLRAMVLEEVERLGLFVEVCPSSNSVIGSYYLAAEHPLVRVSRDALPPYVVVGSDDPLVFATSAAEEIQRLYLAFCDVLGSRAIARQRLEDLVRQSREASFCKALGASDVEALREFVRT